MSMSRPRPFSAPFAAFLFLAVTVAVMAATPAMAVCGSTTNYSVNPAAPATANWTDPIWIPAVYPGSVPCDTATDTNVATTIVVNTTLTPLAALTFNCAGCVIDIQAGGTLAIDGPGLLGNGAVIKVNGGTLVVNTQAVDGGLHFQSGTQLHLISGTISGTGLIDLDAGASVLFDTGSSATLDGVTLKNGGTVTLAPASPATLTLTNGAIIDNWGLIDVQTAVDIANGAGTNGIKNGGTFQLTSGATTTVSTKFDNLGGAPGVDVVSGILALAGDGNGNAPFTIQSGGTLDFPSGPYTMLPGGVVSGAGLLSVSGGTLSIGGVTEPDGFALSGGTLTGNGFLSIKKTFDWSGGTFTGSGGTELAGTGSGNISGGDGPMFLDGRTFNDYGSINFTSDTNPLQLSNGAVLGVYGTFAIQTDGSITCNCATPPLLKVAPNGFFYKGGGAGTFLVTPPMENTASVASFSGTLLFTGGGTHMGSFYASAGATLAFSTATTTFDGFSGVNADGTIAFPSGTVEIGADTNYDVNGLTEITGANVTVSGASSTKDFTFDGGTLVLDDEFLVSGTGTWSDGVINGSGPGNLHVKTGATLTIDAATGTPAIDGITLVNDGTIDYTAVAASGNYLTFANEAFLTNNGSFDIQTDAPIVEDDGVIVLRNLANIATNGVSLTPSIFTNFGTLQKSAGAGTTDFDPELANSGTVKALSGTLHVTSQFTQSAGSTILGPGGVQVDNTLQLNGGKLAGNGTVTGDVQNAATIAPGTATTTGVITITNDYIQTGAGTLAIKLAGPTAPDFDQLAAGNDATLAGTFTATLLNSYAPANGTTWPVLTFASHSGTFAPENLPTYPPNGTISSSYNPTSYDLTASVTPISADIRIQMSGPASVNAGALLTYTITVDNLGPDASSGTITVANTLPAGATAASGSGAPWSCGAPSGGVITCTNATPLPSGQSLAALTISMTAPLAAGSIQNSANIPLAPSDPNGANNTAFVNTTVVAAATADLSIVKSGPGLTSPGQDVVYTISITNSGPSPATNTIVNDATPVGIAFFSNAGACNTPYPCNVGTLNSGQTVVITSTYTVPGNYSGASITNTATVGSDAGDPVPGNNSSSSTATVLQQTDLSIVKSGPASVALGQNVTYTITVTNDGPASAMSVLVADPTPPGLGFVSNSGACNTPYPCNLGTLGVAQSATITTTFSVPANYAGSSISNTATVSSAATELDASDNTSTAVTTISAASSANLSIVKSGPGLAAAGGPVEFTITVFNSGPTAATAVVVDDETPTGLTFTGNSGACATPFPCALGTLGPGQSASIDATYTADANAHGTIVNTASVSSATADPFLNNNSDNELVTIACNPDAPHLIAPAAGATVGSPVTLSWTATAEAASYTVIIHGPGNPVEYSTNATSATASLPSGTYTWSVRANGGDGGCDATSATSSFIICGNPIAPAASVVGTLTTGQTYTVQWTAVDGASSYELQESGGDAFTAPVVFTLTGTSRTFTKNVQSATPFYYRVRAHFTLCGASSGPFSPVARVVIVPVPSANDPNPNVPVQAGSTQPVTFQLFIPGLPEGTTTFIATADKPWLAVTPTSGIIQPAGINVTVSADPASLTNGTWTGTIIVAYGPVAVAKPIDTEGTTTKFGSFPISISLVTPVTPALLAAPGANALIIPAVGHLAGASSGWFSDVRLANVSTLARKYQLTFNAGAVKKTVLDVDAGVTTALDDLVRNWYGVGPLGDSANGVLIIEPLDESGRVVDDAGVSKATIVSSRTYNASVTSTSAGTLGQFIPATRFGNFIGHSGAAASILSLQQVADSSAYHTNLGLAEAGGQTAQLLVSIFGSAGQRLLALPLTLNPGEQRQINSFIAANGLSFTDGRIEVETIGGDGKVTAYASVVDNFTQDPLVVSGVPLGGLGASRFVVPGIADLDTGSANWRSDVRVFNSGAAPQVATLTLFPSSNPTASTSVDVSIAPGEVKALDGIVQSLFHLHGVGGALHVNTTVGAPLVVTARTYNQTAHGTVGQFIPAITDAEAVGSVDRTLQIVQAEESVRYRTNLGITEVSGQPAMVEVTVTLPDSKISPTVQIPLAAYESRQLPILTSFGLGATYNARVSVRVIEGDGRVTAYGSVIDRITEDPTYVPAQ